MTNDILKMMNKRRLAKVNAVEYQRIDKDIRYSCKMEKEKWLNIKCSEIEKQRNNNIPKMYENIKDLTGPRAVH